MSFLKKIKHKLIRKNREAWLDLAHRIFGFTPVKSRQARGLRILVFHGICTRNPHAFNARYLSVSQFEAQLQLITSLYHPVSYHDLITGRLSKDKLNVLLTFDDGLKNNYGHALPLLKKYNVPAMFFVTALSPAPYPYIFNDLADIVPAIGPEQLLINGVSYRRQQVFLHPRYLNAEGISLAKAYHTSSYGERQEVMKQLLSAVPNDALAPFKEYYELMSEAEILEISQTSGMAVGAHGAFHTDLAAIAAGDAGQELKTIAAYLEKVLQKKTDCIAFPYGSHRVHTLDACNTEGFRHCFGTENILPSKTPVKFYERMTINPYVSAINQMYYIAKNNYE